MDGFDFLLRARSVWPDVRLPVIVCTSSNDVEDLLDKSLALGANDYIRKARAPAGRWRTRPVKRQPAALLLLVRASGATTHRPELTIRRRRALLSSQPARAKELVARVRMQIRMREAVRLEKDAEVLRTMLPKHVLNRIWKGEKNIGDAHDKVTVLFSGG